MEWKHLTMVFAAMLLLAPAAFATYTCNSTSIVGDVNGDGQITSDDASAVSYLFAHQNEIPPNICCIDVNGNGAVTNADAVKINIYVNNGGPNANTGNTGKFCYEVSNLPPVISGVSGPTSITSGQMAYWSVTASDPEGGQMSVAANWGDGQNSGVDGYTAANMPATLGHAYQSAGTYTITFTVTDNASASTQSTITTTVTGANSQPDLSIESISISTDSYGVTKFVPATKNVGSATASGYTLTYYLDGTPVATQTSSSNLAAGASEANELDRGMIAAGSHTLKAKITPGGNDANSANDEMTKAFQIAGSTPTVDLKVNGMDNPSAVPFNSTFTASWTSNTEYCVAYGHHVLLPNGSVWTDLNRLPPTGSMTLLAAHRLGYFTQLQLGIQCYIGSADATDMVYVPVTQAASTNQPPVITSVGGPTTMNVNQVGRWSISAYDPDGTYLSYGVNWGETGPSAGDALGRIGSSTSFQHTYYTAGTYTITFTVTDSAGASTQSTSTVVVASGTQQLTLSVWAEPDIGATQNMALYAQVSDNGAVMNPGNVEVFASVKMPTGETGSAVLGEVGGARANQGIYGWTFDHGGSCGTYYYNVSAKRIGYTGSSDGYVKKSGTFVLSSPYCAQASNNLPPVITGGSGPTSLNAGETGTWKVSAYDPDGNYLTYSVNWGDSSLEPVASNDLGRTGNSATFQHTYSQAGTYTIVFTVTDSAGASTQSTAAVVVGSGTSTSDVYASVGAIPTELYQYDSVYVTGKVSRGTGSTNDGNNIYMVALTLSNGNGIPKSVATASSAAQSGQGDVISTTSAQAGQGKEEEIMLAPGESKEVSAYFTASQLGTNFAKIMVYQKINGGYVLVASDTANVLVKQGGIPNPPSDKITLKFERGWNQVSVPTNYDIQLSDIQAKCDITSAWYYNTALGQYSAATTLGKGMIGVWMKAGSSCTYELDAPYITSWSSTLKAGWNMIGAPASSVSLSDVIGDCKITSGAWNYAPSAGQYTYSSMLEPGKGYWVKAAYDCTLSGNDMPPPAPSDVTPATQANTHVTAPAQSAARQTPAVEPAQVQPATAVHPNSEN